MPPTEQFKLTYHSTLQELANHYNSINWNMHSIFILLHSGLIGTISFAMLPPDGALWKNIVGPLAAVVACVVGSVLVDYWRKMFYRHRLFTKVFYKRIRELEDSIKDGDGELSDLRIHTLLGPIIAETRDKKEPGYVATTDVIESIQKWSLRIYSGLMVVAIARAVARAVSGL